MTENLYEILGVEREATADQVHAAFKALAKIHHPDVNGGDDTEFKRIKRARDTLFDPQAREIYDRYGFVSGDDGNLVMMAFGALAGLVLQSLPGIDPDMIVKHDVVGYLVTTITKSKEEVKAKIEKLENELGKVEDLRRIFDKRVKMTKTDKPNFFLRACDDASGSLKQSLTALAREQQIKDVMIQILDDYSFDVDFQPNLYVQGTATTSSLGGLGSMFWSTK